MQPMIAELVTKYETDGPKRDKILGELSTLVSGPLHALDSKSRDAFNIKFNTFKTFLYGLNV